MKRPGRRSRRSRTVAVLPTLFTLGNLVCGFFAIVVAARVTRPDAGVINPADALQCMLSASLIFLAMVFDALDGHVARLARTNSDFGAQLDSLSDLVTFGVAPAFLLVKMVPAFTFEHREAIWVIAATYVVCAALRLARFNVESADDADHLHFRGLPSPAAAASIASFAVLFHALTRDESRLVYAEQIAGVLQFLLPFFALVVALLMVSRVPYPHVVNQVLRGHRSFNHVVAIVFALVAVMIIRGYSIPIISSAFVLGVPLRHFWREVLHRKTVRESAS